MPSGGAAEAGALRGGCAVCSGVSKGTGGAALEANEEERAKGALR